MQISQRLEKMPIDAMKPTIRRDGASHMLMEPHFHRPQQHHSHPIKRTARHRQKDLDKRKAKAVRFHPHTCPRLSLEKKMHLAPINDGNSASARRQMRRRPRIRIIWQRSEIPVTMTLIRAWAKGAPYERTLEICQRN